MLVSSLMYQCILVDHILTVNLGFNNWKKDPNDTTELLLDISQVLKKQMIWRCVAIGDELDVICKRARCPLVLGFSHQLSNLSLDWNFTDKKYPMKPHAAVISRSRSLDLALSQRRVPLAPFSSIARSGCFRVNKIKTKKSWLVKKKRIHQQKVREKKSILKENSGFKLQHLYSRSQQNLYKLHSQWEKSYVIH